MITMKKTKGLLALAIGVALCFAVSAYALTAPRDTQGSISDNASDEPFSELPANEDIFVNSFTDYPDIDAVKQAAHTAYADNEAKKLILLTEYCRPYVISRIPSTGFTAKKWAFGCLPPCRKICK